MATRFVRRTPRRTFVRRKRRWQWIRSTENSVTPISTSNFAQHDLLLNYRTLAGIDLNLPEFTIWRVLIKISIRISVAPAAAFVSNDGAQFAVFVDDMSDVGSNPVVSPYDEKYMLWDAIYAYEAFMQGGVNTTQETQGPLALFKSYDIKTHRKIENLKESLLFQIAPTGNSTVEDYSWTQNTLVLLGH